MNEKKIKRNEVSSKELKEKFNLKFPDYIEFQKEFISVRNEYKKLSQKITITKSLFDKVLAHIKKIKLYFKD